MVLSIRAASSNSLEAFLQDYLLGGFRREESGEQLLPDITSLSPNLRVWAVFGLSDLLGFFAEVVNLHILKRKREIQQFVSAIRLKVKVVVSRPVGANGHAEL
jgi:hypothetical protein